jgi:hypothetical protein
LNSARTLLSAESYKSLNRVLSAKLKSRAAAHQSGKGSGGCSCCEGKGEEAATEARLQAAVRDAAIGCANKAQCDKAFSLAQIYLSTNADMKIQVATES